jgi:hypothetical protein
MYLPSSTICHNEIFGGGCAKYWGPKEQFPLWTKFFRNCTNYWGLV